MNHRPEAGGPSVERRSGIPEQVLQFPVVAAVLGDRHHQHSLIEFIHSRVPHLHVVIAAVGTGANSEIIDRERRRHGDRIHGVAGVVLDHPEVGGRNVVGRS